MQCYDIKETCRETNMLPMSPLFDLRVRGLVDLLTLNTPLIPIMITRHYSPSSFPIQHHKPEHSIKAPITNN